MRPSLPLNSPDVWRPFRRQRLVDVRRQAAFDEDPQFVPGALPGLRSGRPLGRDVDLARGRRLLRARPRGEPGRRPALRAPDSIPTIGRRHRALACRGPRGKPVRATTCWVTRERPKIDRIACPWLVRRFIDPITGVLVPNAEVQAWAAANSADRLRLPRRPVRAPSARNATSTRSSAVMRSAIPRSTGSRRSCGLPTRRRAISRPRRPGLVAASLGLSAMFADDRAMLKWGCFVYDSLYAWCRQAQASRHTGRPAQTSTPEPRETSSCNTRTHPVAPTRAEAFRYSFEARIRELRRARRPEITMVPATISSTRNAGSRNGVSCMRSTIASVLPGPEAQQLATYIGWLMHRTLGRRSSPARLFVLPSLVAADRAVVALPGVRQRAGGRGHPLRHQAGGGGDRAARGVADRLARAEGTASSR